MLVALACMALALMALVAIAAIVLCARMRASEAQERSGWTQERRELLERIQRPERVLSVHPEAPQYVIPDTIPDESNLVGTIRNDPEAYLKFQEEQYVGD